MRRDPGRCRRPHTVKGSEPRVDPDAPGSPDAYTVNAALQKAALASSTSTSATVSRRRSPPVPRAVNSDSPKPPSPANG
jgi:hypothetical protein